MKKGIILVLIITLYVSCFKVVVTVPYDVDFNNTRRRVGLRVIDSTFQIQKRLASNINKTPIYRRLKNGPDVTSVNGTAKKYLGKNIFLDDKNGEIIYEEDVFLSGISKRGIDGSIIEKIIFRYYFKTNKTNKKWIFIHEYPVSFKGYSNHPEFKNFILKKDTISEKQADSLLKKNHIVRLNY